MSLWGQLVATLLGAGIGWFGYAFAEGAWYLGRALGERRGRPQTRYVSLFYFLEPFVWRLGFFLAPACIDDDVSPEERQAAEQAEARATRRSRFSIFITAVFINIASKPFQDLVPDSLFQGIWASEVGRIVVLAAAVAVCWTLIAVAAALAGRFFFRLDSESIDPSAPKGDGEA